MKFEDEGYEWIETTSLVDRAQGVRTFQRGRELEPWREDALAMGWTPPGEMAHNRHYGATRSDASAHVTASTVRSFRSQIAHTIRVIPVQPNDQQPR